MELYPIKFTPIFKTKIWGGDKLKNLLNKDVEDLKNVGESWELSSVEGELSVIANGVYAGKNIKQAIDEFKGSLIGTKVYAQFGNSFPLLIKFIDANDYLSVQVHPDDELAKQRHNSFGKTEMWYIVDAYEGSELIVGFNQQMDQTKYLNKLENGKLRSILNFEKVDKGDVFHLPAGRIHATGAGILFAEIQQTSDITYRIYDWDRKDAEGNERELHTDEALGAIDFNPVDEFKTVYSKTSNVSNAIVNCKYYTTNYLSINDKFQKDYSTIDSFVIYIAVEGDTAIAYSENKSAINLKKGETILMPAELKNIEFTSVSAESKLLEVYIEL